MTSVNTNPASFGVPATAARRSRYAQAISSMYNDLQDCWPCDDPVGSTSLRNLISGGITLNTFYLPGTAKTVWPGSPSVFGNDPTGKSVRLAGGAVYNNAAYTMPSVGTLEIVTMNLGGPSSGTDGALFGNWNGSGIAFLQASSGATERIYKDATNTTYNLVAADMTTTQHWAISWDGTTERGYINGIQRLSQSVGSPATGGAVGIGVYSSAAHAISGSFAWACIYKRALAPGEIAAHAALVTQLS